MRQRLHAGCVWYILMLGWCGVFPVMGQQVSQFAAAAHPIRNEFGEVLQGTDPSSGAFGIPPVEGALVHFLHALDGTIYPPNLDGSPHSNNRLLGTTRIGRGVSPTAARSGRFCSPLSPRPAANSRIFVRVFNRQATEEASFYQDSQLFTVVNWKREDFLAMLDQTDQPLDPADDDGDGLNNSWERSYGSDPGARDTDEDGLSDAEEALARTDLLDPASRLRIRSARRHADTIVIEWDAHPACRYRVERCASLESVSDPWAPATDQKAHSPLSLPAHGGFYRVVVTP